MTRTVWPSSRIVTDNNSNTSLHIYLITRVVWYCYPQISLQTKNVKTSILLNYLDLDTFVPSKDKTTLVKVHNADNETAIDAASVWDDLDLCCPKYDEAKTQTVYKTISDTVPRIK